jgi:hypothetical protein
MKNGNRTSYKKSIDTSVRCSSTHEFICGNSSEKEANENCRNKIKKKSDFLKVKIPKCSSNNSGVKAKNELIKKRGEDK